VVAQRCLPRLPNGSIRQECRLVILIGRTNGTRILNPLVSPNPFDFRTVMFARHTQQDVGLDLIANWTKRRSFADAAYCNLTVAALAALFVIATGILAWQLQLEG
jgi:hypothetical protein